MKVSHFLNQKDNTKLNDFENICMKKRRSKFRVSRKIREIKLPNKINTAKTRRFTNLEL